MERDRRTDAPTNTDEVARVAEEMANRLAGRGIALSGHETPADIVRMLEGVERFEAAVQTRGGDLMVDEGPRGRTTEPDDPHFALPRRELQETVAEYVERVARATDAVLRHPPRG